MPKLLKTGLATVLAISFWSVALADETAPTAVESPAPEAATAAAEAPAVSYTPDTVVATVNGQEITVGHMVLAGAALEDQYRQLPAEILFNGLREQLIQQVVLEQALKEVPRQLEFLIANERRRMLASETVNQIASAAVTDEAVEAAYQRDYVDAPPPGKEYNARHILVKNEEDALAALDRLNAGEDFADVAREVSTDNSAQMGGDLGWYALEHLVEPFANALGEMEIGQTVGPVKTQFGYHIINLLGVRDVPVPTLEEVRSDIESGIEQQAAEEAVRAMVDAAAIVKVEDIDPAQALSGAVFRSE